jgi:hypothetical protein
VTDPDPLDDVQTPCTIRYGSHDADRDQSFDTLRDALAYLKQHPGSGGGAVAVERHSSSGEEFVRDERLRSLLGRVD